MPAKHPLWNFEIAERLHPDAAHAALLNLARMYDANVDLVRGSRRAIAESRELIAAANVLLGL